MIDYPHCALYGSTADRSRTRSSSARHARVGARAANVIARWEKSGQQADQILAIGSVHRRAFARHRLPRGPGTGDWPRIPTTVSNGMPSLTCGSICRPKPHRDGGAGRSRIARATYPRRPASETRVFSVANRSPSGTQQIRRHMLGHALHLRQGYSGLPPLLLQSYSP